MVRLGGGTAVIACLLVLVPIPGSAQLWVPDIFDLAGAWGEKERTVDVGLGWSFGPIGVIGGGALVERGLKQGLMWNPDKTKIFDEASGLQVDPRAARTSPKARLWARVEFQLGHYGGAAMWDPRNHPALGAFGALQLTPGSQLVGEFRWVHTLGYLISVRLRWR